MRLGGQQGGQEGCMRLGRHEAAFGHVASPGSEQHLVMWSGMGAGECRHLAALDYGRTVCNPADPPHFPGMATHLPTLTTEFRHPLLPFPFTQCAYYQSTRTCCRYAYRASKAALNMLVACISVELGPKNITAVAMWWVLLGSCHPGQCCVQHLARHRGGGRCVTASIVLEYLAHFSAQGGRNHCEDLVAAQG